MELLKYVVEKLSGEVGKLLAKTLVEHPIVGYSLLTLLPLLGGVYAYKHVGTIRSALLTLVTYFLFYFILEKLKRLVISTFSKECDLEPCSGKHGVKCSRVNVEYLIKCLERLKAQTRAELKIETKRCLLKRNSRVERLVEKALSYVREGDLKSARQLLDGEVRVCV